MQVQGPIMSASRQSKCLWKTSFSQSVPVCVSKCMQSREHPDGSVRSISSFTSSQCKGALLSFCTRRMISFITNTRSLICAPPPPSSILYGIVQTVKTVGSRKILTSCTRHKKFSPTESSFQTQQSRVASTWGIAAPEKYTISICQWYLILFKTLTRLSPITRLMGTSGILGS